VRRARSEQLARAVSKACKASRVSPEALVLLVSVAQWDLPARKDGQAGTATRAHRGRLVRLVAREFVARRARRVILGPEACKGLR